MTSTKKMFTAIIAAAVLATTGAVAATNGMTSTKAAQFAQAKVSTSQAIDAAERKVGGHASEVDFKHKNGSSYYKVEVLANQQKHEVKIDANSGQVLSSEVETEQDSDHVKNATPPAISLKQAIAAAEAKTGGRAKEADLERKNDQVYYDVEVLVNNGQKQKVKVDAANGAVLSVKVEDKHSKP